MNPQTIAVALQVAILVRNFPDTQMEQPKLWRFEAYDPRKSNEWLPLFEIDDDQLVAAHELREELNRINAPVVLRIVPK